MTARALQFAVGVVILGVVVGSGLAGLAHAPSNDPCGDFRALPEGSSSSRALDLWPLGVRCEYHVGSRLARSEFLGPSALELYAWIVVAVLLAASALLNRESAFVRGAAAAAAGLALIGAAWQFASVQLAFATAALLGVPVVFALDHLLRPVSTRSSRASLRVAVALAAALLFAPLVVIFVPLLGIVIVVLVGALASTSLAKSLPDHG